MERSRAALKEYVGRICQVDKELREEIFGVIAVRKPDLEWLDDAKATLEMVNWTSDSLGPALVPTIDDLEDETIILRMGRPVASIVGGQAKLAFEDTGSETWRARLEKSANTLAPAIASIGRIEVSNHPSGLDYMGTGWLIDDGVVVTNRHVALTFASRGRDGFQFLTGFDRRNPIGVDIDFLEEFDNDKQDPVDIVEVLYIAKDNEPDVAFLRLDTWAQARRSKPIKLLDEVIPEDSMVVVVGYPARDTRVPDALLMDRIFGKVYDKKRLAPGFTKGIDRGSVLHDCTTLGGNSGSPLVDLATGNVCALHYSGAFLRANYAVPSPVLRRMLSDTRGSGGPLIQVASGKVIASSRKSGLRSSTRLEHQADTDTNSSTESGQANEVRFTIPIEITVRVGHARSDGGATTLASTSRAADTTAALAPGAAATPSQPRGPVPADDAKVAAAVDEARRLFGQRQDVYAIEAGWAFTNGWITDQRAVSIAVRSKMSVDDLEVFGMLALPSEVLGVPVDVRVATIEEINPQLALERTSQWVSTYKPLDNADELLGEFDEEMALTLHASPDSGWNVLSKFLDETEGRLTVGMYDFTAPHIVEGVLNATTPEDRELSLVLQRGESLSSGTKKNDIPEEEWIENYAARLGDRFAYEWAAKGGQSSPFKSAYHIKVAVRDGKAVWLSSGNWQSSNQPARDPINDGDDTPSLQSSYNREWHVVIENESIATTFDTYLNHDLEQAAAFAAQEGPPELPPMIWVPTAYFQPSTVELEGVPQYFPSLRVERRLRVQPLLTPDNYAPRVVDLIESAQLRVYFQNQSFSILADNPEHYEELITALLAKQEDGLDVRVIIRNIGDVHQTATRLKDRGFDTTNRVRIQTNCHTKGIIVDSKTVLLGSHNWTGDGTGFNRDASLIVFDEEVAEYYEQLFVYDWERIGPPNLDETLPSPQLADPENPTPPPGMVLAPLEWWYGEG